MREYLPILIVGAIIGVFAALFLVAYCIVKKHKEDMTDRERHMSDKEIVTRLLRYALEAVCAGVLYYAVFHRL